MSSTGPVRQRKRIPVGYGAPRPERPSAAVARAIPQGTTVAGRFRIGRRIASGGMGDVWEGEHSELRLRVALKTLRREVCGNHEVVARFSREAFLMGRIQSDHVARVLDFVADKKLGPVLVMEYVEGSSLASLLDAKRLSIEEAIDLGIDIATGLRELHRAHVVHRDVKPANIILRPSGAGSRRAVFVDLGVGRLLAENDPDGTAVTQVGADLTDITSCDRAVGTAEYMAPEQILSSREVTAAADLYAVGAILYRGVSGRHVFGDARGVDLLKLKLARSAPPLEVGRTDRVATGFQEVVARALAASPDDRYEVADEMIADLSLLRDTARRARQDAARGRPDGRAASSSEARSSIPAPAVLRVRRVSLVALAIACLTAGVLLGSSFTRRAVPDTSAASAGRFDAERCTVTMGSQSAGRSFAIVCAASGVPRPAEVGAP